MAWSPCCPKGSQDSSPALQVKIINSSALILLYGPNLTSVYDNWKHCNFDYTDLCLQRDVSAFQYTVKVCYSFPCTEQVSFNFMAAVTIHSDLKCKKIKSVTASTFSPFICHEVMGLDGMILVFWRLSFSQLFHSPPSPSSRGSLIPLHLLSISVVSSVYLRLLIFLPAIFILACDSPSSAFHTMYSA